MSKLLRKNNDKKDSHLQGAFTEQQSVAKERKETTMVRVAVDVKEELNYIVTVEKLDSVNELVEKMLELYKGQMSEDNLKKLEILK